MQAGPRDELGASPSSTNAIGDPHVAYDYVAVGHVTRDELGDGTVRAGGTAFYSGLQAARLGLRTLIVTQGCVSEVEGLLAPWRGELDLHVTPAERTTTLGTRGSGERRTQRLLAWAGEMVDPPTPAAPIVHLAPVVRELSMKERGDDFVVTPQGLLRRWRGRSGNIRLAEPNPDRLPTRFAAAVLSAHELAFCAPLLSAAQACGACVVVTAGADRAMLQLADGTILAGPPPPAVDVHDDIGAGDVFAAAFFVALREGRDPIDAAGFANAAAAIRLGRSGANAIGTRAQIQALAS